MDTQWERISRLAYCALEDNALLLVLEGGYIHDDLHHSVLEPQSCPHAACTHSLAMDLFFMGTNNFLWYDFLVGTYGQTEGHTGRAYALCLNLVVLAT